MRCCSYSPRRLVQFWQNFQTSLVQSAYNPQMNSVIECIEARNQPRSDPPSGPHTSKVFKRNSAISIKPLPKHLVPCPFLRRRGFCLKGPLCDFQHKNSQSSNNPPNNPSYCSSNNRPRVSNNLQRYPHNLGYTSYPNTSQPIINHFPFPVNQSHFPPFQPPQYHPMLRPYLYPPPLLTSI